MAKKRIREIKKINYYVKLKSSEKNKASRWLALHSRSVIGDKASQIEMDEIPGYVFDLLHNRYKDNEEVNTSFTEDEFEL